VEVAGLPLRRRFVNRKLSKTHPLEAPSDPSQIRSDPQLENGRAKPSPLALKQIEDLLVGLSDNGQDLRAKYFTKEGI
jgi:hypothetical protein